ncbi:MAG: imidazolonepropionase [Candidatus Neomarinimicrobiota bacterium]|nr:imidazolonepropionase [Candidatus Neomarinimicrobiota bacterium]
MMPASIKLDNIGCLTTLGSNGVKYIYNTSLLIEKDRIVAIGSGDGEKTIDCKGKLLTPGFVDSHTHPIFVDLRSEEHRLRLSGATYEEIAENGGGIVSSIESVRTATVDQLYEKSIPRIERFIALGTTTIEAKSGYGLDTESELKSLKVIEKISNNHIIDIVPTFMGAHAFPKDFLENKEAFVKLICEEMIPAVHEQGIAEFIDVFCEEGYFSIEQSRKIIEIGKSFGLKPRIHADEFNNFGASTLAGEIGSFSADHLMKIDNNGIKSLKENNVIATLLPGTTFFLNKSAYAPARKLIDSGVTVALATDFNPGSCHIQSMPFIITLAVMNMSMSIEEAFLGATINGAKALGLDSEIGSIEIGKKADIILWDISNLFDIPYYVTDHPIRAVIKNGEIVFGS